MRSLRVPAAWHILQLDTGSFRVQYSIRRHPDLLSIHALPDHATLLYLHWKSSQLGFHLPPHVTSMSEVVPQVTLTKPSTNNNNAPVVPTVSAGSATSTIGKTGDNASDGARPILIILHSAFHQLWFASLLSSSRTVRAHVRQWRLTVFFFRSRHASSQCQQ